MVQLICWFIFPIFISNNASGEARCTFESGSGSFNKIIYFKLRLTENDCDGATTGAAAAQPSDLQSRVPQFEHIITSSRRGTDMPQF